MVNTNMRTRGQGKNDMDYKEDQKDFPTSLLVNG